MCICITPCHTLALEKSKCLVVWLIIINLSALEPTFFLFTDTYIWSHIRNVWLDPSCQYSTQTKKPKNISKNVYKYVGKWITIFTSLDSTLPFYKKYFGVVWKEILQIILRIEKMNAKVHSSDDTKKDEEVVLPGFRFHPTDEELVGFYLQRKVDKKPLKIELIKQVDIYKYDPWDLPSKICFHYKFHL